MIIHHDIEQNTPEWFAIRGGKVTASNLACVMANAGKAFGEPAKRYAAKLAIEQLRGAPISDGFSNSHTERGHTEEPIARVAYELEMFCEVKNGGFFENELMGCSPDGLIDDDGLAQIKSAIFNVQADRVLSRSFDKAYRWQLLAEMKCTGRAWVDFVSYCADYIPGKELYIYRLYAKNYAEEFKAIDARLVEFHDLVKRTRDALDKSERILLGDAA